MILRPLRSRSLITIIIFDLSNLQIRPEKLKIQKWYTIYKDHITLEDYEIHDGMGLELYVGQSALLIIHSNMVTDSFRCFLQLLSIRILLSLVLSHMSRKSVSGFAFIMMRGANLLVPQASFCIWERLDESCPKIPVVEDIES